MTLWIVERGAEDSECHQVIKGIVIDPSSYRNLTRTSTQVDDLSATSKWLIHG